MGQKWIKEFGEPFAFKGKVPPGWKVARVDEAQAAVSTVAAGGVMLGGSGLFIWYTRP